MPIAPGASLVTITLEDAREGTRLTLRHDVADAATRDLHVQGWRHQLAVFARVASADEHAGAARAIEQWFAAWNERDDAARAALLETSASGDVRFADAHGLTTGVDDLSGHIAGALAFMPGLSLAQRGALRMVHDVALVEWAFVDASGVERMRGTNVVRFAPDGRIADVTGVPA
jgi:hypothetical protein